ncbi:MAG TPA: dihydropteroate synthase [Polyangiaceae bacterium]|nr:dihydropteroate synthase [Polyangiaceae bacterium]
MGAHSVLKIRHERGAALMGVLNVTPDSFYDGGRYLGETAAAHRVAELVEQGADIIDIGGESTRPGADAIPPAEQVARIEPAVRCARQAGVLVSIDTTSAEVAERMLDLGAQIINDVSCLSDPLLARTVARYSATLILMHSRGAMKDMKGFSQYPDDGYDDVVQGVLGEWRESRNRALASGLAREDVWLDPGIGFAKNARQSWELLRRLPELAGEGVPVVVGPSRKSFIGSLDGSKPEDRLGGTVAACLLAMQRGAHVLRVHDVASVRQALLVAKQLASNPSEVSRV